jgi:CubicO group peptidase (beta-lactamase class C family)
VKTSVPAAPTTVETVPPTTTGAPATTTSPTSTVAPTVPPTVPPTSAAPPTTVDPRIWPTDDWTIVDPATARLDPGGLAAVATEAGSGGSDCLVVTRDGALVAEWYWNDVGPTTEQEAFSVTKSITATLVGIAVDRGLVDLDQRASDYIEEWVGTPSEAITIRNLLSNDSGRFQDFETDYVRMAAQAEDKTAFSIALDQQFRIGSEWVYNNAAIQTLEAVLEEATGQPVHEFARTELFEPLGMDTSINTDAVGNTLVFMGAQASCRDLARFGLLYLREGEWRGEQIVSSGWVELATTPSTRLTDDYGLLWWLNADRTLIPGAPADVYAALGAYNQWVIVHPSSGLVVTRMGDATGADGSVLSLEELVNGVEAARTD